MAATLVRREEIREAMLQAKAQIPSAVAETVKAVMDGDALVLSGLLGEADAALWIAIDVILELTE